ncbi:MAG: PqqD family peptide modification chaperone [Halobacteriota archaeon]|nr:PqqD family peptide modification chaperone [Halobacteriota archaeon]
MNFERPNISDNLIVESWDLEDREVFFVLDPDKPSWAFINKDSLEILNLCNGKNAILDISKKIAEKYLIDQKEALNTVKSFLNNMAEIKVVHYNGTEGESQVPTSGNSFRSMAIEITKKCNLRCVHCFLSAGSAAEVELTTEEIKELMRSAKELGAKSVSIGGGEPLMRPDCIDLIKYALSIDLLVALGTNGTLIDEKTSEYLSKLPIKIQISLDGARKETHDYIRGEGSYDLTMKGLNNLVEKGMLKDIVIAFTPMSRNVEEIPEIIDFALEKGIHVIQFPPLSSSGRAKSNWPELMLNDDKMIWFWDYVSKRSTELKGRLDLLAECFSLDINNLGSPNRCSIGSQLRISPTGDVYPCQCFHFGDEYCIGNVRNENLGAIISSQKLGEILNECYIRPLKIESCVGCKWKNFCGAGCMGSAFETNGTVWSTDSCNIRRDWIESLFKKKFNDFYGLDFDLNQSQKES